MKPILTLAALCGLAASVAVADEPLPKPAAGPLSVEITGTNTYPLDLNGATPKEYADAIDAAVEKGEIPPPPPAVDLKVVIKNTGKEAVTVFKSGDPFVIDLTMAGKGAKNVEPPIAMTLEFRIPEHTELGPGMAMTVPVEKLTSGMRGMTRYSYWTDAGEYTLTAKVTTGVSPAPAGAPDDGEGFGRVVVTSEPFRLTVTPKQ